MKDAKLGVAIHGVGNVAYAHAASWMKNPHAAIVSISSRRKESARRLVEKMGLTCTVHDTLDEVLKDDRVDIVNLSGPNHVHADQGIAAAEAGKHILIEKPMARTMLRSIRVKSKAELKERVFKHPDEINADPVVFRWKYRIEELSVA